MQLGLALCYRSSKASLPTTFLTFSTLQPSTDYSCSSPLPNKKKNPTKYLFFLTSPHRTGKRLHKAHVPAHGWLVPVGWLTITWVSVSFALCKDSKLAHFSTLVPPVLMDRVGISCLWDLCLQSYLKWAKGSPKFTRGHHSSNLFSQQG